MNSIRLDRQNRTATLTLARGNVHNAFDDTLIAELTAALEQLDADDAVRRIRVVQPEPRRCVWRRRSIHRFKCVSPDFRTSLR